MVGQKNKTVLGAQSSPEFHFTLSIGKNEVFGVGAIALAALAAVYFLFKWFRDAHRKTLILATHATESLMSEYEILAKKLSRSNEKVAATISESKVVPHGYVQVPLKEGVSRHVLTSGYVIRVERKLEHRAVAEDVIGRELVSNELVHHIYGPATDDNRPENLCILDKDQHDFFHTYVQRERTLKGRYPTVANQRRVLKDHFEGILLDEALTRKEFQFPPRKVRPEKYNGDDNIVNMN